MAIAVDEPKSKRRRKAPRFLGAPSADVSTSCDIVDSHAYIMPAFDAANGNAQEKLAWMQDDFSGQAQTVTVQLEPTRSFVDPSSLADVDSGALRSGLEWTRDDLGRPSWKVDDKRYVKGNLPAYVSAQAGAYSAEQQVAAMDFADVTMCILQHRPALGDLSQLYQEACKRYPQRFRRLITVHQPSLLRAGGMAGAKIRIDVELEKGGVAGFQVHTGQFGPDWDCAALRPLWDHLATREVPVWFTIVPPRGQDGKAASGGGVGTEEQYKREEELFKAEVERIVAWCQRYESTDVVVTSGLPWRSFLHADRKGIGPLPKWVFKVFEPARVHLEMVIPTNIGDVFDFPYKEAASMLERLLKRVGPKRLLFGSEMPFLERTCTYTQSVRHIARYSEFMTVEERAAVLGKNARRIIVNGDKACEAAGYKPATNGAK